MLAVINDALNHDMVVRPGRPYVTSDARVFDFTDREKYPLATDHVRFAPIPLAEEVRKLAVSDADAFGWGTLVGVCLRQPPII